MYLPWTRQWLKGRNFCERFCGVHHVNWREETHWKIRSDGWIEHDTEDWQSSGKIGSMKRKRNNNRVSSFDKSRMSQPTALIVTTTHPWRQRALPLPGARNAVTMQVACIQKQGLNSRLADTLKWAQGRITCSEVLDVSWDSPYYDVLNVHQLRHCGISRERKHLSPVIKW